MFDLVDSLVCLTVDHVQMSFEENIYVSVVTFPVEFLGLPVYFGVSEM